MMNYFKATYEQLADHYLYYFSLSLQVFRNVTQFY